MSQPELGGNQIVRFVTNQAPAPQAQKNWGLGDGGVLKNKNKARRGEGRVLCALQNCEVVGSHLGLQAAPNAVISCTSYAPQASEKMGRGQHPHLSTRTRELRWTCGLVGGLVN